MTLRPFRHAAALAAPLLARATRGSARRAIEARLGPLQGASTKVAQLLAAREGRDTGAGLKPIPLRRLLTRITPETRAGLESHFSSIDQLDRRGRRASLGQVHQAITDSGRTAAVKLSLPGVDRDLASDLSTLGWVGRRAARRRTGLDAASIDDWLAALGDELLGELDLPAEAERQRAFRAAAAALEGFVVPEVIGAGPGLLVTAWEPGASLEDAARWEPRLRAALAERLARGVLEPLFQGDLAHGDLHPGNVAFRAGERPVAVLYDFGATRETRPDDGARWERLLLDGSADPLSELVALGFDEARLAPLAPHLVELCALVFGRLRGESVPDAERQARVTELLGDHRLAPRLAAPTRAIPVVRTIAGLVAILGHLDSSVALEPRGGSGSQPARRPEAREADATVHVEARTEDGRGVEIRLPFHALEELDGLLPERARAVATRAGIDLRARALEASARGPVPATLVDEELDGRRVRIRVVAGARPGQMSG